MNYKVIRDIDYKALEPIEKNVQWKLLNNWDDYNELHHCLSLLEKYKNIKEAWVNTHTVIKDEKTIGCLLIVGGKADFTSYKVEDEEEKIEFLKGKVMLNYFHVSPEERGIGEQWIRKEIIPFYKKLGVTNIYVKSSHKKAWSLYKRLGIEIGDYESVSDNYLYKRKGKIFRIKIS